MTQDLRTELARQYHNASRMAYKDIEYCVTQASFALSRVAMSVHHRAAIFGDDAALCGDYITTTIQAAQSFVDHAVNTLAYAHFFDRGEDKNEIHDQHLEGIIAVNTVLAQTNQGLMAIAETDTIDETFPPSPETDNPREDFKYAHLQSLERLNGGRISAAMRRDRMPTLLELIDDYSHVVPAADFTQDRETIGAYNDQCERQGREFFAFENKLKEMKLAL